MPQMTDEQTWAILIAPDEMIDQQLADQLGLTYSAVHSRRWTLRRQGWSCRVTWDPCHLCGEPLIRPNNRKRYHAECRGDARRRANTAHVTATTSGRARPYSKEEDELIITHSTSMTIRQIAMQLGRTYSSVARRLARLRERESQPPKPRAERNAPQMTDEQIWAIVTAPEDMSASQIANTLGLTPASVNARRWLIRREGWSCEISWDPCAECGDPLIKRIGRQTYHEHCRPLVSKRLNASYEPARQERMTPDQLAARDRRRDEHYDRSQASTIPYATSHFRRYTPEDDAILIELIETMTHDKVALEVGRTWAAVNARLQKLRKRNPK